MGSSASQQNTKQVKIKSQISNFSKQREESPEHLQQRKSVNGTPKIGYQNSPNAKRSPLLKSSERVLEIFSPNLNDKHCGQSSVQASEISEQDQSQINNVFRPRKVSRFQEQKLNNDIHVSNLKDHIPLSSRNDIVQIQKDVQTQRSIQINDSKRNTIKLNLDSNIDDNNQIHSLKDHDGGFQFHNDNDFHSKYSNNDTLRPHTDRAINSNILSHIQQFGQKLTNMRIKNEQNLFSNESDIFFRKKDYQKEDEKNLTKISNSQQGTQIVNNMHSQTMTDLNQKKPNSLQEISKSLQKSSQSVSQLESNQNQSGLEQINGDLFKHEVIQISKSKNNKEFFKKGNVYLLVQDENSSLQKKLSKNDQENIISDLITNNISITDFLVSEKEDIQEQILINQQKKKLLLQQQQMQESKVKQKTKRNYRIEYDNQQQSSSSLSDIQNQEILNKSLITQQMNNLSQTQLQKNIIISYNQEWEQMRSRGAFQSSVN
ncbi:hypothetical protein TTHERM_00348400 (macronuclear) [Tetrahymena thermophila SB210]|uniref:Uncharacterized protein n=1 Tax=Tetrahymena thermophila (strain SB210) TaxID=312017 RepID=I7M3A1_TETTS|nr:hypothetical protein TTHERM_00348400 [Tetrahymena thermophila SB210]EAS02750.2 hypothetical protein TTHERM_00348400 [Tetrahymena thermophila SB210]|eukprot:XP_001022995.2 hypothetical protein TTHERM_00348400 [Tetrahymena thermophila SB210]